MKTKSKDEMTDELRSEYDLGRLLKDGVRGKYLDRYREGTNLVLLEPDVAEAFPTEAAVNGALRSLIEVARRSVGPAKRPGRRRKSAAPEL
jgi:hypothetical protein